MRSGNRWARPWRVGAIVLSGAWLLASCGGGSSEGQGVVAVPKSLSLKLPASVESTTAAQFGSSAMALDGLKFQWDFGDGTSSSDAAPSHTYARGGEYEVKLTVKNAAGDSTETRSSIVVTSLANVRGLQCSGSQGTGWCWQNPRPMPISAPVFYFLDAKTGFRSGESGVIYSTTDGGATWTRGKTGAFGAIVAFRFLDSRTGWAVSSVAEVLRTVDGGISWTVAQLPDQSNPQVVRITALNPKVLHVKLDEDHVTYRLSYFYSSSDGGATWRRPAGQAALSPTGRIWNLEGTVLHSSDDAGLSYADRMDFAPLLPGDGADGLSLFVFSDTRLVVTRQNSYANRVSVPGRLIYSLDRGATWTSLSGELPGNSFRLAWASPDGQVYIGEGTSDHPKTQGVWARSSDGGKTWAVIGASSSTTTRGDVYAAQPDGSVERYDVKRDVTEVSLDGLTWQPPPASTLRCQWPFEASSSRPIAGCLKEDATSRRQQFSLSDDGGKTWRVILDVDRTNTPGPGVLIDFGSAKRGFMIDRNGDGRSTTDGGLTWQLVAPGLGFVPALYFVGEQTGWLIDGKGQLLASKDGGKTWERNDGETYNGQPNGADVKYYQLGFDGEKLGWYRRQYPSGDINFTQYAVTLDGGLSWQQIFFPPSSWGYTISMRLSSKAWLALHSGYSDQKLLVSMDQGKTWVSKRTPENITTPVFAGDATIWAFSSAGQRLYRSDDYGGQWQEVELPAELRSLNDNNLPAVRDVKFANAKVGWIVDFGGMIVATKDGGKTWVPQLSRSDVTDPLVALRVSDSQTAWAIGHYGAILATGTGGD